MSDNSFGNTAGRIVKLLRNASSQAGNRLTGQVWAEVLECQQGDGPEIFGRLLLIRYALDRVQQDVTNSGHVRSAELLLPHLSNIRRAISPNHLHESWDEYKKLLRNGELLALEVLANELPSEDEIPDQELKELEKLVSELGRKIHESNIDSAARLWSLDLLEGLRRSLQEYRIRGADGLRNAISSIIGELARHAKDLQPREDEWWLKELWSLVVTVDGKVEKALKSQTIRLAYRAVKSHLGLPDFTANT